MNSQTVSDCSPGNRRLLRPEHRWLKTDQQVRLHLNCSHPTTVEGQAWLSMFSSLKIKHADKSFHMIPPCISNGMMFSRSLKRGIIRGMLLPSRFKAGILLHIFLTPFCSWIHFPFCLLAVHPSPAVHQPSQTSRAHLLQTINSQKIFHHYEPDARSGIKLFYSLPIQNQGSWLVGCVSRQN